MEEKYIDHIVNQYFKEKNYTVKKGNSGMNNTTKFLIIDNEEYILRIYESHKDKDKVSFEHKILKELGDKDLSFNIPSPKVNLNGDTIGLSVDGKLISMAKSIKGINPDLKNEKQFYSLGQVVGEITKELGKVNIKEKPIYEPCYELEKSYPKCPLKDVINFCDNPPEDFYSEKEVLKDLKKYFIEFKEIIPILRELPHQFIHGDINASNVLEDEENNICAVLDFEFAARDLRCMDLAICISEAISNEVNEKNKFSNIASFIKGYNEFVTLTEEEIKVIPYLIMLRRLDVIVHFLVRYNEGINNSYISAHKVLKDRIVNGENLCRWIKDNKEQLVEVLSGK